MEAEQKPHVEEHGHPKVYILLPMKNRGPRCDQDWRESPTLESSSYRVRQGEVDEQAAKFGLQG